MFFIIFLVVVVVPDVVVVVVVIVIVIVVVIAIGSPGDSSLVPSSIKFLLLLINKNRIGERLN